MAVEFLVADAFVNFIFEVIELLAFSKYTTSLREQEQMLSKDPIHSELLKNLPHLDKKKKKSESEGPKSESSGHHRLLVVNRWFHRIRAWILAWNPGKYGRFSNFVDLLDIFTSFALGYFDIFCGGVVSTWCPSPDGWSLLGRKTVRALVFLLSWRNVQPTFAWAEEIAWHVLPILRSAYSLWALLFWTLGVWLMSSQLLYLVNGDARKSGLGSATEVFYFFFSGEIGGSFDPYHDSDYVSNTQQGLPSATGITIFLMALFLVFNIWILNIFISVIGIGYEMETGRVRESFTQTRTGHILTYLLRKKCLRLPDYEIMQKCTRLCRIIQSKGFLNLVLLGSIIICFLVTTSAFFGWKPQPAVSFPLLISAVFIWNLVQFQTPTPADDIQYLWLLKDKEKEGFSWREERRSSHMEEAKKLAKGRKLAEERTKLEDERTKLAEERKQLEQLVETLKKLAPQSDTR
jgi:hypothetical protein